LRVEPTIHDYDAVGAVTAGNKLSLVSGDVLFAPSMALNQRKKTDAATARTNLFFVSFEYPGPNSWSSALITDFIDERTVVLDLSTPLIPDATATFFIYQLQSYDVVPEISSWEVIKEQITFNRNTVDLTATPTQDAATINYWACGVQEPINPTTTPIDPSLGDTMYSIGMPDPKPARGKSRTSRDVDFREDPIQITVI
jgi:hypothetical protein